MKEKINSLQFASIFTLCIISSSIGLSLYTTIKIAGIDSYFSVIFGSIMGLIPLFIFMYIFNYEKDKPLYEKNTTLFGKYIGNFINYLITFLYAIIGGTILFNCGNFIVSQYLSDVPLIEILIIMGLIILYAVNKGFEVISRVSSISIVIVILFFVIGYIFLVPEIKLDNLKPILEFGLNKPIIAGFVNMLITLSPIYTLLIFPKNNLTDMSKINKYIGIGYVISLINLFLLSFISNSILGKYLIELYQYPGYISFRKISMFGFIDRIENLLSLHWILSSFITLSMIIYYIKGNIKRRGNNRVLNAIVVLVIVTASYKLFKNNTFFNNYLSTCYPYVLLVLFLIFIIITIGIFIKNKIKKDKKNT